MTSLTIFSKRFGILFKIKQPQANSLTYFSMPSCQLYIYFSDVSAIIFESIRVILRTTVPHIKIYQRENKQTNVFLTLS